MTKEEDSRHIFLSALGSSLRLQGGRYGEAGGVGGRSHWGGGLRDGSVRPCQVRHAGCKVKVLAPKLTV